MIKLINIPASALKFACHQVSWGDVVTDPNAIDHIIVELRPDDSILEIVDGYHRAAGVVSGPLKTIEVIACRAESEAEEDLIAAAAVAQGYGGMTQEDAIAEIRRRVGL